MHGMGDIRASGPSTEGDHLTRRAVLVGGAASALLLSAAMPALAAATWTNPMLGNVDGTGQKYGDPRDGGARRHRGYDIGTGGVLGRPVLAASAGVVTVSSYQQGFGHHVLIDHGGSVRTLYAHLAARGVATGQSVGTGQQIGLCGNTGGNYAIHLHLQVHTSGTATSMADSQTVDPKPFFLARGVTLGKSAPSGSGESSPALPPPPSPLNQEEPVFVAINRSSGMGVLVYPSGYWTFVSDGADAVQLASAGIPTVNVTNATWVNLTPGKFKLNP